MKFLLKSTIINPENNEEIAIVSPKEKFLVVLIKFFRLSDELVEIDILRKRI